VNGLGALNVAKVCNELHAIMMIIKSSVMALKGVKVPRERGALACELPCFIYREKKKLSYK
jgi:hypothetical protein